MKGELKVIYNLEHLVSAQLMEKEPAVGFKGYLPPRKGCWWKLQLPRYVGKYSAYYMKDRTEEEIITDPMYAGTVMIEDHKVYLKPYVKLRFSDGQERRDYQDTEELALARYNFYMNQIKNPLQR